MKRNFSRLLIAAALASVSASAFALPHHESRAAEARELRAEKVAHQAEAPAIAPLDQPSVASSWVYKDEFLPGRLDE